MRPSRGSASGTVTDCGSVLCGRRCQVGLIYASRPSLRLLTPTTLRTCPTRGMRSRSISPQRATSKGHNGRHVQLRRTRLQSSASVPYCGDNAHPEQNPVSERKVAEGSDFHSRSKEQIEPKNEDRAKSHVGSEQLSVPKPHGCTEAYMRHIPREYPYPGSATN